jgi:rSAM/selenodomain-associated transferase 1
VIIVFARAPVPGRVKTRLVPKLGEWGAARLHVRLMRHALQTAAAARCGPVELHGTARHTFFSPYQNFHLQRGADLGARMHHALSSSLKKHERVILIGADCPELAARDLRRADRLLRAGCDAVIAPAQDGGYALIALRRCSPLLFEGIGWGGPEVCAETLRRLQRLGWRWRALRTVWDLDRPEDLARLGRMRLRSRRSSSGARRAARR